MNRNSLLLTEHFSALDLLRGLQLQLICLSLALLSAASQVRLATNSSYSATCKEIAASVSSSSKVYYPSTSQYQQDNYHYSSASSQNSTCSFEPANAQDVGIALQIISKAQTPFAVKSGGYSEMPGFSSTPGVQIAMESFSDIVYDAGSQTVTVGMGLIWDDVYSELQKYNMTVVGGKFTGIGVAGMVLGGGYSYLTNQYGLSVDNVLAFQLVLPNGTVTNVTNDLQPDLFYGLRGGFNNFGIVITATLQTYPQGDVWGGLVVYAVSEWDSVNTAVVNFLGNVTDPKASLDLSIEYFEGATSLILVVFYDAPDRPAGIFDELLSIPYVLNSAETTTYLDLIQSYPVTAAANIRSNLHWVVLLDVSASILQMIMNQTLYYGAAANHSSGIMTTYNLRSFLPSLYNHSDIPSAFPSVRGTNQGHYFIEMFYGWTEASDDDIILQLGDESAANMMQLIRNAGQDTSEALLNPNNSPYNEPLVSMYGDALSRLHSIRTAVDPNSVMNLAGGWRF